MGTLTEQEITVVLGSGRSGTSVITKALQTLGCSLGDNLISANPLNPKGFFEDHEIGFGINEEIIARLGQQAWYDLTPAHFSTATLSFADLSKKAENILTEKFKLTSWCAFKDPRTSKLLHFWQPLFKHMALKESYIIALRNPLSSISSFEKYDLIHPSIGFFVWLTHLIPAIENTLEKNMLIVNYEAILANPKEQLERIQNKLNHSKPLEATAVAEYSDVFLDPALSRNPHSYEEFRNHPAAPPICIQLYDLLNLVASDKLALNSNEFKAQWLEILYQYRLFLENFSPIFTMLDTILHQARNISNQKQLIDSLLSSHSWRLTAPLRKMASILRKK